MSSWIHRLGDNGEVFLLLLSQLDTKGVLIWSAMSVCLCVSPPLYTILVNTLRQRQNWRHFADVIFKCIFLKENVWISLKIPLKFVPKAWIKNVPVLVQIMAWHRPGNKPLSEPMMVSLSTHIYITRPHCGIMTRYGTRDLALVQVMACCLCGEPVLSYHQLEYQEYFSEID